jgi:glucosamine--fructose-6-phosphate aminotransferase (isomerizing)
MKHKTIISNIMRRFFVRFLRFLLAEVHLGKRMSGVPVGSIVFFPHRENILCCGLAGVVSFKNRKNPGDRVNLLSLNERIKKIETHDYSTCVSDNLSLYENYMGGYDTIDTLLKDVRALKNDALFYEIYTDSDIQKEIAKIVERISAVIATEEKRLTVDMGHLRSDTVEAMSRRIEALKDIAWHLKSEIKTNIVKIKNLLTPIHETPSFSTVNLFKKINAVLNSIDRLEVRGRDSAGISLMFILDHGKFQSFMEAIENANLLDQLSTRTGKSVLLNMDISIRESKDENEQKRIAFTLSYKIAAEIGSLGDNIDFLRKQIKNDSILQTLVNFPNEYYTVFAHTRWASVGAISEPNCHPVDNKTTKSLDQKSGIIHTCLNGDIDNYLELKKEYEKGGDLIPDDITTDTKIIPLQIEKYVREGHDVEEAFRLAVNDFEGSHAITMLTDLAPGKLFLAQKGSGQAIFIGIAENHYIAASEVYGLVEETPIFLKLDGEKEVEGKHGRTRGQIFILDQESVGGLDGIKAIYYDTTPVKLDESEIKQTDITSRDIDRQEFAHYFLKEITGSPLSVARTLQNRWKIKEDGTGRYVTTLDKTVLPESVEKALVNQQIQRIFFIGQGTAGVAALACADILNYYMDNPAFYISALKASELSGFKLNNDDGPDSMTDALIIAISQSGTTTDTNRTVDMVRERGAHTIAIVNRRDSDITFKVDGVMYTSSGRDVEMSVASTKAFYSQIVAGAILSLKIARLQGRRNDDFVSEEIKQLIELPTHMEKILAFRGAIENSAKRLAVTKTYWAVVGSGPNKASSDEIRIKLSELCYKTISSDYVEDKKHIDLSSEPLIIVCAAGTRSTVIGDIIKDTAIFHAHKATPVVIADEGENRFDPYAADVFHVPIVSEHIAPIVNTLVGHLWGYYAALAINDGSRFLHGFREDIRRSIDDYAEKGLDVYEVILEKSFREKIAHFYNEFRRKKVQNRFPTVMGLEAASNLTLLLKYLSGRLPVNDFEIDFDIKGTALNMLNKLFESLGESVNCMSRPVDAIKHQAKTVTVGTSRISEKVEGILFEALTAHNINISQLTNSNIIVLKNLQGVVSGIEGSILYSIGRLNLLGEPVEETTIEVIRKEGVLKPIPSRVETDTQLKGTKRIIVRQGNVYIGKGRKDDRSILIIPVSFAYSTASNMIGNLLLLNISFKENASIHEKAKALGGKYEHIKNIVQENSIIWEDRYLALVAIEDLFGISAEKIGDFIVSRAISR